MCHTRINYASQELLDLKCLQRALPGCILPFLPAHFKVGRRHQATLLSGYLQQCANKIARRGLAIGAGDADRAELIGRIPIKSTGKICQRSTHIPYLYIW